MQPLVETLVLRAALDEINGAQSLHAIIDTRRALDLGIAVPLTRAMKGTTNPHLWELVEAMTEYAHTGSTYLEQDIAFHSGLLAYIENEGERFDGIQQAGAHRPIQLAYLSRRR